MKRPALKPALKLGAEAKKIKFLAGLVVLAIVVFWWNRDPSPNQTPTRPAAAGQAIPGLANLPSVRASNRGPRQNNARGSSGQGRGTALQEFKPTLKLADPVDPSTIDPILKLNLLAKLGSVTVEGAGRSLFDFSNPPAPKVEVAAVKPIVPGPEAAAAAAAAVVPPKPPPPPIPLKYYGFTNVVKQGRKKAFFLEGEDIYVAGEGDVIKNRYKIVRIGVNSAVVEDTSNQNQQTVPLEAEGVVS